MSRPGLLLLTSLPLAPDGFAQVPAAERALSTDVTATVEALATCSAGPTSCNASGDNVPAPVGSAWRRRHAALRTGQHDGVHDPRARRLHVAVRRSPAAGVQRGGRAARRRGLQAAMRRKTAGAVSTTRPAASSRSTCWPMLRRSTASA